ncbi:MAG: RHS repeat-associated core domain-containing protein [Armatimonadota bacterium]|nr:RHS repeat-associated core domain-containing protein [Armatimonadota bacterium]
MSGREGLAVARDNMPYGRALALRLETPGHRDHGDAGLLHVGARYYDPQVGRFLSRDAVLSEHPYLYGEHEPVNRVDPSGHEWLDNLTNFFAGMGDTISFGLTERVREWLGVNDVVDYSSGWYIGGELTGYAWWFFFNYHGYRTGYEFRLGRNFRIAPWGNRRGHKYGEWPHYHRRGRGGIARHRPWEPKASDRSFWDRF